MKYMVIATVDSKSYMVKVEATSACGAEHFILDMAYCGHHEYGVEGAEAFDAKTMKTDFFVSLALDAQLVSLKEMAEIIEERNAVLKTRDEAEDRIREIERQMKSLTEELEAAKKILAA